MTRDLEYFANEHRSARRQAAAQPAWLAAMRDHALERFLALGFPTTRDEEWRFTSVAPIAETAFRSPDGADVPGVAPADDVPAQAGARLVFVDGRYAPDRSSIGDRAGGVIVESLAAALASAPDELAPHLTRVAGLELRPFTALNTAFLADGAFIRIPARAVVEAPIHLVFLSSGSGAADATMSHPRTLVLAGEGAQATIVERYAGTDGRRYLTNAVTEVVLGAGAVVDHYKLQRESLDAFHVGSMHVHLARDASFSSHAISLGGSLVRNDVIAVLDGEGAECTLNGLYVAGGRRLIDNHTTIDHAQPHCDSREIYKGILADQARGVFNGKIVVRPDAQKTDAKQTNRALLLSEDAQINTKPQLEIYANDVKCTHGAAVGQLDRDAMFYLRSRGLSAADARTLLIQAFAGDVLRLMRNTDVRAGVEATLLRQLAALPPAA